MSHITEVVAIQKLNNGQISVCVRCCGNPSTDHWHTMAAEVCGDTNRKQESIAFAHKYCAEQHAFMDKAMAEAVLEIGTLKQEHDV